MNKKSYIGFGGRRADEFLKGEHSKKFTGKEAERLGTGEEIIRNKREITEPIKNLPDLSEDQFIKKEVLDPIAAAEFQLPDYFYLKEYQEIYINNIGKGAKTKAFFKEYFAADRKCEIWLPNDAGEIDFKQVRVVHQNLVYVKKLPSKKPEKTQN